MKRTVLMTSALTISAVLASALATTAGAKPETRVRDQIPSKYRWDFAAIYADWAAWEVAMKQMEAKMDDFAKLKGTLSNGPTAVLNAYKMFDEIGILQYKVYRYPQLQRDVDTRNQDVSARYQKVGAVFAKFGTSTAWFSPELLKIPQPTMEKWLAETPALQPYRFGILDRYRQQQHVLDEKGEKLLSYASQFSGTPTSTFQELSTSDIKFPTIKLADGRDVAMSPGNYQSVLQTDYLQADRAKAFSAHIGAYTATANTYSAIYNGVLQRGWFQAQARNYPTTIDAALDGDNVPRSVVETLVSTVRGGTAPLQRYAKLRKKLLKLDEYHLYDTSIPVFRTDKVYPYDDAVGIVLASVAPLGTDYVEKYRKFVSGGRVDVYENEGKRSGAYNAGVYGVGPFLLLNYNDTLSEVFTLAHEGGHAMHTVLSYETQPFATADYTIFVAEVASTTNERFLLDSLLAKTTDPKERFLLLQHAVDNIVGTFYTQTLFADFELQAHKLVEKGEPITPAVLSDIYSRLLKEYYGDAVTLDDAYKFTWTRIPHFYNSPYYVYQYATCFASSAKLYRDMTSGPADARKAATDRYLTLLKSGGNDYPMTQLQKAGVDLTKRETVQAVVDQMEQLVTQMEAEAAKISG